MKHYYFHSIRKFRSGRLLLSVLFFALLIVAFYMGINSLGKSSIQHQQDSLKKALQRDIVECYAIEGVYPPSLEYLKSHYGLTYDSQTFFVDYQPLGSNLYPDYTVIIRREGMTKE